MLTLSCNKSKDQESTYSLEVTRKHKKYTDQKIAKITPNGDLYEVSPSQVFKNG